MLPPGPLSPDSHRLLVCDDDPAVREMLIRVLREAGYRALPAEGGAQAVALAAQFNFNAVLLDLGMPGEDGWSTLQKLQQHDPELPVIVITAWPHQHAAAWKAGASGCFEKPLDFPELLAAIARLVPELPGDATSSARRFLPARSTLPAAPPSLRRATASTPPSSLS